MGAPGTSVSRIVIPASASAWLRTRTPAGVAGAVAHAIGMTTNPQGTPARPYTIAASSASPSNVSGLRLTSNAERMGRDRSASAPPATARAIATAPSACSGSTAVMSWTCLLLFVSCARSSWSGRTATGRSPASTACQRNPISGSASASRETVSTSATPDARRRPVSKSTISAALPSSDSHACAPSRARSAAGSRAARVNARGADRSARSTSSARNRTRWAASSTRSPAAARSRRTGAERATTPTRSRTSSAAAWIRAIPSGSSAANGSRQWVSGRTRGADGSGTVIVGLGRTAGGVARSPECGAARAAVGVRRPGPAVRRWSDRMLAQIALVQWRQRVASTAFACLQNEHSFDGSASSVLMNHREIR